MALGSLVATTAMGKDKKVRPPAQRRFASPSGTFALDVTGAVGWPSPQAHAELFAVAAGARRSLWSRPLPQRYGPALAVVSDEGTTLLVDEWIRTPSPYALVVIGVTGETIGAHSMADIAAASGVSPADLAARATDGPWMSAPPSLDPPSHRVVVEAGGIRLVVDLATAQLSRAAAGPTGPPPQQR